jgi:hypothetical protein
MRVPLPALALALVALATAPPAPACAQSPTALALDRITSGALGAKGEPKRYRLTIAEAGILTLAGNSVGDLVIAVLDEEGQTVPNGHVDRDLGGDLGSEYGVIHLGAKGDYGVEVRMIDASGPITFSLGASFIAMESFRRPADPDGRPSAARAVEIGTAVEDELNGDAFDRVDWYSITAVRASTVVLMTRTEAGVRGDLGLEAFQGTTVSEYSSRSDQDQRGGQGNESLTLDLKDGETARFRVLLYNERGEKVPYRLSVALVP